MINILKMGSKEKLIARFQALPTDFTWDELSRLLKALGYESCNKGKTSGSRVIFRNYGKAYNAAQTTPRQYNKGVCDETGI